MLQEFEPSHVFAAIASPRRREILRLTWDAEQGAGEIRRAMPDVSWGAVSLQVHALVEAGLLDARIDGRRRYYRANRDRLAGVAGMLESMWADVLWKLKLAAELEATRRGPVGKAKVKSQKSEVRGSKVRRSQF